MMYYLTREVWPDDVFGTEGMDVVEQRDVLKKIFLDPISGVLFCVSVCLSVLCAHMVIYIYIYTRMIKKLKI